MVMNKKFIKIALIELVHYDIINIDRFESIYAKVEGWRPTSLHKQPVSSDTDSGCEASKTKYVDNEGVHVQREAGRPSP